MKKIILASLVLCSISSIALADEVGDMNKGSGSIKYTGTIIDAPCSIAPGSEKQEISLGQISNSELKSNSGSGMSTPQPFSIKLEGCTLEEDKENAFNTMTITFNGTEADDTGFVQITGDAAGAGVKIMNQTGSQIKINEAHKTTYVAGNNELNFQAALQGLGKSDAIETGEFTATTTFKLAYQ